MEFKSEYYTPWSEYEKTNNVSPDNADVIKANTQTYEEMVFDFTMWLIM
ncbi:hypothetical protein [Alkalibaculum sporogenes]|nr:hypothetical protein [Alkalibaculum sporogenes]